MRAASRITAGALFAVALGSGAVVAPSAEAGGTNWKTMVNLDGARLQMCKQSTGAGDPWKVKLRLDATDATRKVAAVVVLNKNKQSTGQTWSSPNLRGQVSDTGSLRLPRDDRFVISGDLGDGHQGAGDLFAAGQLGRC